MGAVALALAALALTAAGSAHASANICCGPWQQAGQLAVTADGRNVYVSDYLTTLALRRDAVTGSLELIDSYDGGGSIVELSPDGRHVYVAGFPESEAGGRMITVFKRDENTGALSSVGRWRQTSYGTFRDLEFRDNRTLYVSDQARDALITLTRDEDTGKLAYRGETRNGEGVEGLSGPGGIALEGDFLYVSQTEWPGGIGVFGLAADGSLLPAEACDCFAPGDLESHPGGNRLIASGSPGPYWFARDPGTGTLAELSHGLSTAGSALDDGSTVFDHGGVNLYVAGGGGVSQFDGASNGVTPKRTYYEGRDGQGLRTAQALSLSPDGRFLYVAGGEARTSRSPGTIAVFSRTPATGELAFASLFTGPHFDGRPHDLQGKGPTAEINGGAEYTNDRDVMISVDNLSPVDTSIDLSNDGGFKHGERRAVDETKRYPWTLASTGPTRLPKTVYVRVNGATPYAGSPVADEIILDETAPVIVFARARSRRTLKVKARDNLSGVAQIQVARGSRSEGWKPLGRAVAVPAGHGSVRVRVRDRAKNPSRWRTVR